jgi:hypothetical protein
MKNVVFWDVTPCCSVFLLLVTADALRSSLILVILMMAETRSSETSVLTRATRRYTAEGQIVLIIQK